VRKATKPQVILSERPPGRPKCLPEHDLLSSWTALGRGH
jgi:hypothetical protein